MGTAIKKFEPEIKAKFAEAIAAASIKAAVEATKAASDSDTGTFDVIVSTQDVDRHGEAVMIDGWILDNYKANPVVLWAHDYGSLPIGITTSIAVQDGKLRAQGKFVPAEANPFAQQVRALYDLGAIKATSVGFIAEEMLGNAITKAELLEFSFVPVPANPYCLTLEKAGFNVNELVTKGLFTKDEENKPEEKPEEKPAEVPAEKPAEENKPAEAEVKAADDEDTEKTAVLAAVTKLRADLEDAIDITDASKPAVDAAFEAAVTAITAALDAEPADEEDPAEKALKEKDGRVLSEKNRNLIKSTIDAIEGASAALKELHSATEPKGGEDKTVKVETRAASDDEISVFLFNREALRVAANAVSSVLAKVNEAARDHKS